MKKTKILEYDKEIVSLETDTFKIIKFDKNSFEYCTKIMDTFLKLSGVYFISRINQNLNREIYVGQTSNGFQTRIKDPNHKWNEFDDYDLVIWITKANPINLWTKNELDYIEQYFIKLFINQMIVLNNNDGNKNNGISLNSEKQFLLNEEIKAIKNKLIMIAGDKLFYETTKFEQVKNFNTNLQDNSLLKIYAKDKNGNQTEATFNKETNSVMLKKGTIIITNNKKISSKIINEINLDQENKLRDDTWFNSPSKAAALVSGYSVNGWDYWKQKKNNKLLTEIRE